MKLIHCADLHLDSKMNTNLDKEHAKERKAEMLHTFERMVQYAAKNGIEAILIAGDMFDTKSISAVVRNTVLSCIRNHREIIFYYLRGNHDNDNFLSDLEEIPSNLKMFGTEWTVYRLGNIVISGIELSYENIESVYASLMLDARNFNIVMMHGQEAESESRLETINLRALRNKGIDYLALGHIHSYKKGQLDARGLYCYPGCLEGRGFDECGSHGFVVLDIDEITGKHAHEFVPFAQRQLYTVPVDVTDCETTAEMVARATIALQEAGCGEESLVKIVLTGSLDVECEKDPAYILSRFKSRFYYVRISDETALKINIEDYMLDESLKGEYVRIIMGDDTLSENDKKIIIRYGLQAIAGEEVQ